jgi:hypothetical protein
LISLEQGARKTPEVIVNIMRWILIACFVGICLGLMWQATSETLKEAPPEELARSGMPIIIGLRVNVNTQKFQ